MSEPEDTRTCLITDLFVVLGWLMPLGVVDYGVCSDVGAWMVMGIFCLNVDINHRLMTH